MRNGSGPLLFLVRTLVYFVLGLIVGVFVDSLVWNLAITIAIGLTVNYYIGKRWKEYFG